MHSLVEWTQDVQRKSRESFRQGTTSTKFHQAGRWTRSDIKHFWRPEAAKQLAASEHRRLTEMFSKHYVKNFTVSKKRSFMFRHICLCCLICFKYAGTKCYYPKVVNQLKKKTEIGKRHEFAQSTLDIIKEGVSQFRQTLVFKGSSVSARWRDKRSQCFSLVHWLWITTIG